MKQLKMDEEATNRFLYEPQLARDMKAAGWTLTTSRSEAVGELGGVFLKVIQDQDHRTGVLVTIMHPKPTADFFRGNYDDAVDRDMNSKRFKPRLEALHYEIATTDRTSTRLILKEDMESIRLVLEKVKKDLPELKALLVTVCDYAVRRREQRAKQWLEGFNTTTKELQNLAQREAKKA